MHEVVYKLFRETDIGSMIYDAKKGQEFVTSNEKVISVLKTRQWPNIEFIIRLIPCGKNMSRKTIHISV